MKTYIFVEKNGNAVIHLSENSEDDAWLYLEDIVKSIRDFRLETEENEEN